MNKTILPWVLWLCAGAALGWALLSSKAHAGAILQSGDEKVRIVLYTEECGLAAIKNLPHKAQWIENGKIIEGCVGLDRNQQLFTFYFADRTAFSMPMQMFTRITES